MTTSEHYDVVIAGGGMVGASLALLLAHYCQAPLKVLVVERFAVTEQSLLAHYSPSFDSRSTALSYGSRQIFERLGLWSSLAEQVADIAHIHVSERGAVGSALMHAETMGWSALGHVVENVWLGRVLMRAAYQQPDIDFACPATLEQIQLTQTGASVTVVDELQTRSVNTQLLVIADGAQSSLRDSLGIDAVSESYQQSAIVTNVCFQKPHAGVAYERFTDTGPMALLPLASLNSAEPRAALIWSLPPEKAQSLCEADDSVFLAELQRYFGHRVGAFTRVGERVCYPLQLVQAEEQVRSAVVVMGNAAHSLHPVAGQGFNLALRDCARLVDCLVSAQAKAQSLGSLAVLNRYQQAQQFDQQKTIAFSDQIGAFFANQSKPLVLLRALGLATFDASATLKSTFVRHAAGVHDGAAVGLISGAIS